MTDKESKDPIISRSLVGNKNDIMIFKNETLKDFKEVQKKFSDKYNNLDLEIKQKLEAYEIRITNYENKIIELSKLINTDKTIRDKVDSLMEFKEKTNDTMLTEKIRLDNTRNDLSSNVERIDQILKDSVIYPGIIGGISKYKTFHDLIDYILTQLSQTLTFREKSILDFKGYKTKLENTISSFNTQINTILNTTNEFTKTCVKELEEKIHSIFNVYDDRLQDSRLENANYAVGLERATESLKKELEKLEIIKQELYEKVDNGIAEVKNDNTRVTKLFAGYKKNFHVIQHKFTQISEFIKDVRFRINLKEEVKRREFSQMSDLINFDKKKKPGFYDGVYNINVIKKGFTSQLKDYIEGRITADQLFKKTTKSVKSSDKSNENIINNDSKKIISGQIIDSNNLGEEVKLNFVDLFKETLLKKTTSEANNKKEIIKEENESNNSSLNFELKNKKENNNNSQRAIKNVNEAEKVIEDKKQENNKKMDKKDKDINKKEENRIQIISKDKEDEKNNSKNDENNLNEKKSKTNMKKVIHDLFNVKNIIDNMKNKGNESFSKDKIEKKNEIDKLKNNLIADNNRSFNTNNLNNDINKNIDKKKIYKRPGTVVDIKRNFNGIKNAQQNNIGLVTNNEELDNPKNKRLSSSKENKKIRNSEAMPVNVNIYNATMNSLGQNFNQNNKTKSNSSNQKKSRYYLNSNSTNTNKRIFSGFRKEDTQPIEIIFNNNFNNNMPKNNKNKNEDDKKYYTLKKNK